MSGRPLQLRFETSAAKHATLPPSPAEVAFVGRSNVGKSSVVNALANQRQLAHVSKTPGRTQLINLFRLPNGGSVVDLPGYGYAAVGGNTRAAWSAMIERYLLERACLELVFVLVDGEIGPTRLDLQMLDWLRHHGVPHAIVATKLDKVKPSRLGARKKELAESCGLHTTDVLWVSAAKGNGIDVLRGRVNELVEPPAG